ncbi:hypothetical protein CAPTEDRAFT_215582 [Capitella teleta]|uniref:WW domain-containing protein n=1 Tax=Capitella teleta TaxID=283909 RepID=R7THW4_CAPTE|nr:hypothetical protein CAPTEDRAFT_215582 [Capitella teleta]|eukprot:ELT93403.1 hypothetical protein CAPTEDRAFT_215582 [Capitella teleta]
MGKKKKKKNKPKEETAEDVESLPKTGKERKEEEKEDEEEAPLPDGWLKRWSKTRQCFYYGHPVSNISQWERPTSSAPTPSHKASSPKPSTSKAAKDLTSPKPIKMKVKSQQKLSSVAPLEALTESSDSVFINWGKVKLLREKVKRLLKKETIDAVSKQSKGELKETPKKIKRIAADHAKKKEIPKKPKQTGSNNSFTLQKLPEAATKPEDPSEHFEKMEFEDSPSKLPEPCFTSFKDLNCMGLTQHSTFTQAIYIIVDTNVFIHDLEIIKFIAKQDNALFDPVMVIPWVVMQELDALKNGNKEKTLSPFVVIKATKYLNQLLEAQHPRVKGQTPREAKAMQKDALIPIKCNDDEILQCCLQCQESYQNAEVCLLTFDVHLRSKAVIAGIKVYKEDIMNYLSMAPSAAAQLTHTQHVMKSSSVENPHNVRRSPNRDMEFELSVSSDVRVKCVKFERELAVELEELERAKRQEKESALVSFCNQVISELLGCCLENELHRVHWIAIFGETFSYNKSLEASMATCLNFLSKKSLSRSEIECLAEIIIQCCAVLEKKKLYEDMADNARTQLTDTLKAMTEFSVDQIHEEKVFKAFQIIWESVLNLRSQFEQNLSAPVADRDAVIRHLQKFCVLVFRIHSTYQKLLSSEARRELAEELSLRLVDFASNMNLENHAEFKGVHSSCILSVLRDPTGKEKMSNGLRQLESMMSDISKLEQYFTPTETVTAKSPKTCIKHLRQQRRLAAFGSPSNDELGWVGEDLVAVGAWIILCKLNAAAVFGIFVRVLTVSKNFKGVPKHGIIAQTMNRYLFLESQFIGLKIRDELRIGQKT